MPTAIASASVATIDTHTRADILTGFTLSNPSCTAAGCPFSGGGKPGPCTATSGILSDTEIGNIIGNGGATVTLDKAAAVKIVTWGEDQWVNSLSYNSRSEVQETVC